MAQIVERGIVEHELGVHINQRHEDYLLDPGLGYGAVVDLFLSPTEWWDKSPYNPNREVDDEERRKHFMRGTALHTHVLDGPRVYARTYDVFPSAKSHPDYLDTVAELTEACRLHRLSTHGLKADLVERLVRARAPVKILAAEQERFRRSGKLPIAEKDDFRIKVLYAMMMRTPQELKLPDGDHLTLRDLLTKSLNEVSVFWVDEFGIRHRARFDILKPNITGDLKSITAWRKSNFEGALLQEIIMRGYMIQAVHYYEARIALRKAVAEGRIFGGNKTQRKLLEKIARAEDWAWAFVFAKMDGAPQVKGIVIRRDSGQFIKAQQQREQALAGFLFHRDFHGGLENAWFDPNVVIQPADSEWPQFSVLGE